MKDLRIVIPAYNEEKSIAEVIDQVRNACPDAEAIVVDDCSKDSTAEIADRKEIFVLRNPVNLGKGGATKAGFKCKGNRDIKYLAFIDSDNTYPADSLPQLYRLCREENIDMVVGSRLLKKNRGMPKIRRFGNWIFAIMLSFYSGKRTTDTSTGLRVFNARMLNLVDSLPDGLDFDTAMTTRVLFEGLSYAEVPINYYYRAGKSKLNNLKDGYRFLKVIMNTTRQYKPTLFFCTLGIPFLLVEYIVNKMVSQVKLRDG
ncbi:MAG: glycosyltransferase family 2 protein [Dehalococcoidia bacterium]